MGISKRYALPGNQTLNALDNISFTVRRGEVVALIGPSGSGKSTCLRAINALETIDSGRIQLCGHDLGALRVPVHTARRHTAMIFQHFELFPHLNVLDNVRLALRLTRAQKLPEATEQAERALEQVGMAAFARQNTQRLSGGQKQRVAIARALAIQPEILLCDEPTSALDPELVGEITELLGRIAASGMTMLVVTHEMGFARHVSSRCLFMEKGRLLVALPNRAFFGLADSASPEAGDPGAARVGQFLRKLSGHAT